MSEVPKKPGFVGRLFGRGNTEIESQTGDQPVRAPASVTSGTAPAAAETVPEPAEAGASKNWFVDRKSTRLNSSHIQKSRMPSSA